MANQFTEIVTLWVYYTIHGFSLILALLNITFHFLINAVWLRITDEGSVPEMRIWFILLKICYDNPGNMLNKGRNFNTQKFGKMYLFVIYMISRHWFQTKLLL